MAITGRFEADFTPFMTAVQAAEVELKGLETSSSRVEKSLNRMVDQFSGRRMIQDANLMAEAVERIGGVSQLTQSELERVGAKAAEAAEKMRAIGMDVPERLQNLALHAKDGASALDRMGVAVGTFIGNFAFDLVQRGVSSIMGIGTAAFESAGHIADLSQKLGISAEAVQGFDYAAKQTGTTIDSFAGAINKLNINLAKGDDSTINALKSLGLEYDAIRAMKPEDAFLAIADGIAAMPDPMERARVGTELMGKGFADVLPAIMSGLRDTADSAAKMSDETVDRLDRAGDAWQALYDKVVIVTGGIIAEVIAAGEKMQAAYREMGAGGTIMFSLRSMLAGITGDYGFVADAAQDAANTIWGSGVPAMDDQANAIENARETMRQYEEQQKARQKAEREAAAEAKKAAEEFTKWGETFEKVTAKAQPWQDVLATNDAQLNEWVQTLLRAGNSVEDIAKAYSVSTGIVEANSRALRENDATLKMIERTYSDLTSLTDQYNQLVEERTLTTTERQIADINRWADTYKGRLMERGTLTADSENMIDAIRSEKIAKLMVNEQTLHEASIANLAERAQIEQNTLQTMVDAEVGTYTPAMIEAQREKVRAAAEAAGLFYDAWGTALGQIPGLAGEAADGIVNEFDRATEHVVTSWSEAMDQVRQGKGVMEGAVEGGPGTMTDYGPWGSAEHKAAVAKAYAAGRYFGPVKQRAPNPYRLPGMSYDVDWEALGIPGTVYPKAAGGPVDARAPYLVGEQGPELFVPTTSGSIVPNGATGSVVVNNTFHVNGTGRDVARVVLDEINKQIRVGRKWPAV